MSDLINQSLHIIGLSIVTSNDVAHHEIGQLWQRFLTNPFKDELGKLASSSIFSVYSDYENGTQGQYRVTLGYAVPALDHIPNGLSAVTIPPGKYRTFKAKSAAPEDIVAIWQTIWSIDNQELRRNFIADYEEYSETEATVKIGYVD